MPYGNANISTDEQTFFAASKPIVNGRNSAELATAEEWNEIGTIAATNRDDATFPPSNAFDEFLHVETKPSTSVVTGFDWYLILTLPAGVEYDWVGLAGHNLETIALGGALTVEIDIADDGAFTVNPETIDTFTIPVPSSAAAVRDKRFGRFDLDGTLAIGTAQRITGDHFIRIRIFRGATDFVPEIGELVLGRRRQLRHKPNRPRGAENKRSKFTDFVGGTAGRIRHKDAASLVHLVEQIEPADTTRIQDMIDLERESDGFNHNLIWVEDPFTNPNDWAFGYKIGEDFNLNELELDDRIFAFEFLEDGFLPLAPEVAP